MSPKLLLWAPVTPWLQAFSLAMVACTVSMGLQKSQKLVPRSFSHLVMNRILCRTPHPACRHFPFLLWMRIIDTTLFPRVSQWVGPAVVTDLRTYTLFLPCSVCLPTYAPTLNDFISRINYTFALESLPQSWLLGEPKSGQVVRTIYKCFSKCGLQTVSDLFVITCLIKSEIELESLETSIEIWCC